VSIATKVKQHSASIYTSLIALLTVVFSLPYIYVVFLRPPESAGTYRLPVLEFMTDRNLLQTTELDNLPRLLSLSVAEPVPMTSAVLTSAALRVDVRRLFPHRRQQSTTSL
jgi:hypothetical protein